MGYTLCNSIYRTISEWWNFGGRERVNSGGGGSYINRHRGVDLLELCTEALQGQRQAKPGRSRDRLQWIVLVSASLDWSVWAKILGLGDLEAAQEVLTVFVTSMNPTLFDSFKRSCRRTCMMVDLSDEEGARSTHFHLFLSMRLWK